MSLQYRASDGTETTVAGLAPAGQLVPSVSLYQTGSFEVAALPAGGYADSGVISLQTPFPDTDYIITFDFAHSSLVAGAIEKSASNFHVVIGNVDPAAGTNPSICYWKAFKLMTDESRVLDETHIEQNTANFAPSFSTLTSYAVGDYVTYNNILYRCTTAHTAGVWVAGHFTQVTVGSQLKVQDISSSITMEEGYASGQIYVFRDGNTVQVLFNSVVTTGYSKAICSGLPKPLHSGYFCVQADADPQELGLAAFQIDGSINSGTNIAGMAPSKVWDGFMTYLTRD